MKKIFAIMLVIVLVFTMATVALAESKEVISPQKDNTDVDPDMPDGTSPQTGEQFNVLWIAIAAVAFLAIAFVCIKKLVLAK